MFVKPEHNVGSLGLTEGMRVADLGAGTGYYTKIASAHVGHTGHVYAIEVQKDMLKRLESELKEEGIKNVDCIWGDIEHVHGTKLADASVDRVIVSNVLFQVSDKLGLIDEAKRILKRGGRLLLVDWRDSYEGIGPAPHHVVREDVATELFEKRGFKKVENSSASSHHYGIIFKYE